MSKKSKETIVRVRRASCRQLIMDAAVKWVSDIEDLRGISHILDKDYLIRTRPVSLMHTYLQHVYKLHLTSSRRRTVKGTLIGKLDDHCYKVVVDRYISYDSNLLLMFKLRFAAQILNSKDYANKTYRLG
jgi:hypothetical protein